MAKRPRETVEVQDFAAAIEPDDDSCEEEEVDAKEQLLKEGNAEEAWQLYLDEEQAKYWRAVSVEANAYQGPYVSQDLPLARVKRVMKVASCFNPRMIGADAAPALAFLGECFIRFLTRRAWSYAAVQDRRTLQYKDILDAMASSEQCDFLVDVVHEFNKHRIQHRHTKDAQRVRALMNGYYETNNEGRKDDEGSVASAENGFSSVPTLASSGASTSSASSSHGAAEEEADEGSMLGSFDADDQCQPR